MYTPLAPGFIPSLKRLRISPSVEICATAGGSPLVVSDTEQLGAVPPLRPAPSQAIVSMSLAPSPSRNKTLSAPPPEACDTEKLSELPMPASPSRAAVTLERRAKAEVV